jgi:hypothetical protein
MRIGVLALAAAMVVPAAVQAQANPGFVPEPHPNVLSFARFAVTPFVGLRVPYGSGTYYLLFDDGTQFRLNEDRGGGTALGLQAEAQIAGPLNFVASGTYSSGNEDVVHFRDGSTDLGSIRFDGPAIWFAKAGLSYRIPDPAPDTRRYHPSAAITVAPAVVFTRPRGFDGAGAEIRRNRQHFALNLGVDAAHRIGSRGLALHLGVEDYITFWNASGMRVRDEALFGEVFEEPVLVVYDRTHSNLFIMRLGVSFRF